LIALQLIFAYVSQKKQARLQKQEEVKKRQAAREEIRWETFFLVQNGGNPDGNSPIRSGFFSN